MPRYGELLRRDELRLRGDRRRRLGPLGLFHDRRNGVLGSFGDPFASFGLQNLLGSAELIKAGYGATFAVITVALISSAIADRAKFTSWAVFVPIWITLVYCPLAFMVWVAG